MKHHHVNISLHDCKKFVVFYCICFIVNVIFLIRVWNIIVNRCLLMMLNSLVYERMLFSTFLKWLFLYSRNKNSFKVFFSQGQNYFLFLFFHIRSYWNIGSGEADWRVQNQISRFQLNIWGSVHVNVFTRGTCLQCPCMNVELFD